MKVIVRYTREAPQEMTVEVDIPKNIKTDKQLKKYLTDQSYEITSNYSWDYMCCDIEDEKITLEEFETKQ